MATNAASHNPGSFWHSSCTKKLCQQSLAGVKTNPVSGPPPQPSSNTISAISKAAASDPLRQHVGGVDGGDSELGTKMKSEKECMKSEPES